MNATPPARKRPITRWNVLALLAAVVLGGATLAIDQAWLRSWAVSGRSYPIAQQITIGLPQGESLVYYESPVAVPRDDVVLKMWDQDGERVPVMNVGAEDISYRLLFSGWSGRAMWRINVPRDGEYVITCHNYTYLSDSDRPAEDRVVFQKEPDSLHEVTGVRRVIQVTGATFTMTAVIVLYLLHGTTLRRARNAHSQNAHPHA